MMPTELNTTPSKPPKQVRRQQNRAAWQASQNNMNAMHAKAKAAKKPIAVPTEPIADTGSLARLRQIMGDINELTYRRVEAAETILSYELAPGSAVNVPPDQIAAASYLFLQAVVDDVDTPSPLRFKALRSLASIENARARVSDTDQLADRRVHLIELINAARRRHLMESGRWPAVCASNTRWQLEASDDIDIPRLAQALDTIGGSLDRAVTSPDTATRNRARQAALLSISARNRVDAWRG